MQSGLHDREKQTKNNELTNRGGRNGNVYGGSRGERRKGLPVKGLLFSVLRSYPV